MDLTLSYYEANPEEPSNTPPGCLALAKAHLKTKRKAWGQP